LIVVSQKISRHQNKSIKTMGCVLRNKGLVVEMASNNKFKKISSQL